VSLLERHANGFEGSRACKRKENVISMNVGADHQRRKHSPQGRRSREKQLPIRAHVKKIHHQQRVAGHMGSDQAEELLREQVKKTSGWTLARKRREIQRLLCTWTGSCSYCGGLVRAP
jgi:hypothetical protein